MADREQQRDGRAEGETGAGARPSFADTNIANTERRQRDDHANRTPRVDESGEVTEAQVPPPREDRRAE